MEQIYLLLRMAMADHLTRPGEICPLLMDDVTVESDAGRKLSRYHWLMTTEEIVAAALKLDHKERARLAGRLLRSLDEEEEKLSPAEFEALWLEEAERRLEEWEQGKVEGIPGDKVMKELRDLLA